MIVPPARRRPSRSAASTIRIATRSLIEPPGLKYSTLATICGVYPCPIRLSRTSGVSPTVSRSESLISDVVAVGVMRPTIGLGLRGRSFRHRRGRLVARLAAREVGLLDAPLLHELGQRVVRHGARDLRHVGDLGRADPRALAHQAEDRLAVGPARRPRARLARRRAL